MSDKTTAWMPIYLGDYLGDTTRLTTEQHGAYLLLLFDYWRNGPPPNDDAVLAQITRLTRPAWKKMRPTILGFFKERDGKLFHGRVEKELESAKQNQERRSAKASRAARARWEHDSEDASGNASSIPQALPDECPPPSPSSEANASAVPAPDLKKQVFDLGLSLVMQSGKTETEARQMVGLWRKGRKDADVLAGFLDCQAQNISSPLEWLQARFKGARWVSASGYEYRGSDQDVLREAERRGDNDTYWAVKAAIGRDAKPKPPGKRVGGQAPIGQLVKSISHQSSESY